MNCAVCWQYRGTLPAPLWYLGFSLIAKGQAEDAIPVLEKAVSITNRSSGVIGGAHQGVRSCRSVTRMHFVFSSQTEAAAARKAMFRLARFVNVYLGMEDREQTFALAGARLPGAIKHAAVPQSASPL